jgi:hypothetical protein
MAIVNGRDYYIYPQRYVYYLNNVELKERPECL